MKNDKKMEKKMRERQKQTEMTIREIRKFISSNSL